MMLSNRENRQKTTIEFQIEDEVHALLGENGAGEFTHKRNLHPISIPPIGDCPAGKG